MTSSLTDEQQLSVSVRRPTEAPADVSDSLEAPHLLISARLQLPPHRAGNVRRRGVVRRLNASEGSRILSVVAPAGFGKTTAVAQWLEAEDRPTGVVVVSAELDDPGVFLQYLAAALASCGIATHAVAELLTTPDTVSRRRALEALCTQLSVATQPFVLVIDDADRLQQAECLRVLSTVVESVPSGSQICLCSRETIDSVATARLRANGDLAFIGVSELRFDANEARKALAYSVKNAPEPLVREVVERTEGWPFAIHVASQVLAGGGDLAGFGGAQRDIADYLEVEFLDFQPPDKRQFLLRTAVLEDLHAPLCDYALNIDSSAHMLDSLERVSLLVTPLDEERLWYRYHPLLGEMLRRVHNLSDPKDVAAIRGRASSWCESEGDIERAVAYAQANSDHERVAQLVLTHSMRLYAQGREDVLISWFDWLWASGCTDTGVAVLCAWLHLMRGSGARAAWCVEVAEHDDPERQLFDGSPVKAWTNVLRAAMAREPLQMRERVEAALGWLAPASRLRPSALVILGFAELLAANGDAAEEAFREGSELGVHLGASGAAIVGAAATAALATEGGRWDEAESLSAEAEVLIERANMQGYVGSSILHATRARIAAHRGDRRIAETEIHAVHDFLDVLNDDLLPMAVLVRSLVARAQLELGNVAEAAATCHDIEALTGTVQGEYVESVVPRLREHVAHAQEQGGARLTPAELRLAPWLATQLSFREVAERLFLSLHTVKAQVTSIYRKLGVTSRTGAVGMLKERGVID